MQVVPVFYMLIIIITYLFINWTRSYNIP